MFVVAISDGLFGSRHRGQMSYIHDDETFSGRQLQFDGQIDGASRVSHATTTPLGRRVGDKRQVVRDWHGFIFTKMTREKFRLGETMKWHWPHLERSWEASFLDACRGVKALAELWTYVQTTFRLNGAMIASTHSRAGAFFSQRSSDLIGAPNGFPLGSARL